MGNLKNNQSLFKLTLVYSVGNLSSKVITFALFFYLTYFLSKNEIGEYDIIISSVQFLIPIISLQLQEGIFRWLVDNSDRKLQTKVFTNVFVMTCCMLIVLTICFLIIKQYTAVPYPSAVYVLLITNTLLPLFQQCVRGLGDTMLYSLSGILHAFTYTIVTVISVSVFHLKIEGLLFANTLANILVLLLMSIRRNLYTYFSFKDFDLSYCKELLRYTLPLLPSTLSWWGITNANRYIITMYLGIAANGVFAVTYKFPSIVLMLNGIFLLAWQEKAILNYTSPDRDAIYADILKKYNRLLLSLLLVLATYTKLLFLFIVEQSYQNSWIYAPILYLAVYFSALTMFYATGYLSSKKTKGAFYTAFSGGIVTIILCFILIPIFGLHGVSCSMLIGYILTLVLRYRELKSFFYIKFPLLESLFFITIIVITSSLSFINHIWIVSILQGVIIVPVLFYFNKEALGQVMTKLRSVLRR